MPEPSAPEQSAPQPIPEVAQTPRQRVEASFQEREKTVVKLNLLNNPSSGKWGWEWTKERYTEEARLKQQLGEQIRRFREEIVSNEPEAQAWVKIEEEKLKRTLGDRGEQALYGTTPTDREYASLAMRLARQSYDDAVRNLENVRKQGASASTASK